GRERAVAFDRGRWREQFGALVEQVLEAAPRPYREKVSVRPRTVTRSVTAAAGTGLVPGRLRDRGPRAVVARGPARVVPTSPGLGTDGNAIAEGRDATPLPGLLVPGQEMAAAVPVPVPAEPGAYQVAFWAERAETDSTASLPRTRALRSCRMQLLVHEGATA